MRIHTINRPVKTAIGWRTDCIVSTDQGTWTNTAFAPGDEVDQIKEAIRFSAEVGADEIRFAGFGSKP